MNEIGKYRQYFDIDSKYFPCIDDTAIEEGALWENTYPHDDFISLLKTVERMLGGTTKRSVWIHGAYGTGKSQCAYALRKILEVPEDELKRYWSSYRELDTSDCRDLLSKILGHKDRGILVVDRYASGDITNMREFFRCVQDSIKDALDASKFEYKGLDTLKEAVIKWIDEEGHEEVLDVLLRKPEWKSIFAQSNALEIREKLIKSSNVKELMNNISRLASKEGLTAMSFDSDKLKAWIRDITENNKMQIVFIWDEFSHFFKNNRNSLDEFQKIISLCEESSFFFIPVTHQTDSIINDEDKAWSVVRQRFNFCEIKLPDNIAFKLIGHAFAPKKAAADAWNVLADDLNSSIHTSRQAVMKEAKITDENVIKDIMPIHPMAAMVLKHIASAFQSNQRSMFDFIKTNNVDDVKAFQWFIENTGPGDDYPLLTIDMLWNFFYEKGRENLTYDIRSILDTYQQHKNLRNEQQRVLKTILIMQAIDKRLGGIVQLLKPTEKNISYAFEGISSGLDVSCKNIAKGLKDSGILVLNPIGNNEYAYGAAVLAGDQAKIDEFKQKIRSTCTTSTLITDGNLGSVLNLSPALRLRFGDNNGNILTASYADFTRKINELKNMTAPNKFKALLAFAKNDSEASLFNGLIKETIKEEEYKDITIISALPSFLSDELFNQYVEFEAMAMYYQGNNNTSSNDNRSKAKNIISQNWKNAIYQGAFIIYTNDCPDGERYAGGYAVCQELQAIVRQRYNFCFDFNRGVSENALKPTQVKASAKCGIIKKTSGAIVSQEKAVLDEVWNLDEYWNNDSTKSLGISIIKRDVDALIHQSFNDNGHISMAKIVELLEEKYGFICSNIYAFLIGFLLKEYSDNPYRFSDIEGSHENMSSEKLAEMISNSFQRRASDSFIVRMTKEEKAFYELTTEAWSLAAQECSSVKQTMIDVQLKMRNLGQPIWCLEEICDSTSYDILKKYIEILQCNSEDKAHSSALSLGKIYLNRPSIAADLKNILTVDECKKAMHEYLKHYADGKLIELSSKIGANEILLSDVSKLFEVDYSNLWNKETGNTQIDYLINDYEFILLSNDLLDVHVNNKKDALLKWKEKISFMMCSHESLENKYPKAKIIFDMLLLISEDKEILPEQFKLFVSSLYDNKDLIANYISNEINIFYDIYSPYLDEINIDEIPQLKRPDLSNVYKKNKTDANILVKSIAESYKKDQLKNQILQLWKNKTNSKNPKEWSYIHKTPIILLVEDYEFELAKNAFDVLNRNNATDKELNDTMDFLITTKMFDVIDDQSIINDSFKKMLLGYEKLLDLEYVREKLSKLSVEPFDWSNNPNVAKEILRLAQAQYDAGGSDKIVKIIENMSSDEAKKYLIDMVKDNIEFGAIILNKEE